MAPRGGGAVSKDGRGGKTVEVELRRRPGEGFGFVIASQEVTNGGESERPIRDGETSESGNNIWFQKKQLNHFKKKIRIETFTFFLK